TLSVRSAAVDGRVRSFHASNWATCQNGSNLNANSTDEFVELNCSSGPFEVFQYFVDFATTSVPDAATIDSYTFTMYGTGTAESNDNGTTLEARIYDWGGTVATSNWRTPANFSAATLFASFTSSGWNQTNNAANNFTSNGALASINKTGTTYLVVTHNRFTGSAPTGDNYIESYTANQSGTASDPLLVVNYTAGENHEAAVAFTAAAAMSAAGKRGRLGAWTATSAASMAAAGSRGAQGAVVLTGVGALAAAPTL